MSRRWTKIWKWNMIRKISAINHASIWAWKNPTKSFLGHRIPFSSIHLGHVKSNFCKSFLNILFPIKGFSSYLRSQGYAEQCRREQKNSQHIILTTFMSDTFQPCIFRLKGIKYIFFSSHFLKRFCMKRLLWTIWIV